MTLTRRGFLAAGIGLVVAACNKKQATAKGRAALVAPTTVTFPPTTATVPPTLVHRLRVGCYVHDTGVQANPVPTEALVAFEDTLGRPFDLVHYFMGWNTPFADALNGNVPTRDLAISWAPTAAVIGSIVAGAEDTYISNYARDALAYGHPVYIRFGAEMNGSWNSYSSAHGGPSAAQFVLAWHRVVGIFKAVSADNVKFVWCPNELDSPDVAGNHLEDYWPGPTWVDIIGFDGYNWSNQLPRRGNGAWRSFDQICADPYARVAKLDPNMPIWIGELGCTERTDADPPGVSKGTWFADMFASRQYPRLSTILYFSTNDASVNRDWRIDTSPASIAGWKAGWTATTTP